MRHPALWRDLAELRTHLGADFGFHQLAGDQRDRLLDEVLQAPVADLPNDMSSRHL